MRKLLKYAVLLFFAVLVLWGGWSLLHPAEDVYDGAFVVVLDPGHGGDDPGAVVGEAMEKDLNLEIALLVRDQLAEQEDITVVMTREEDFYPSLTDRTELANEEKADLYVSIHANALENDTSYAGVFTFYHPDKHSDVTAAQAIQEAVVTASGGLDRGVRSADYAVLRETDMPAVLIETGFMTCPEELAMLQDSNYQTRLARGIAQGILACRTD